MKTKVSEKTNKKNIDIQKQKDFEDRPGIVQSGYDFSKKILDQTTGFIGNTVANAMGYQPIQTISNPEDTYKSQTVSNIQNTSSRILNGIGKESANVVESFNKVIDSPHSKEDVKEALKHTSNIIQEYLQTIDKSLDDPKLKEQVYITSQKIGELTSIALEAAGPAIDQARDKIIEESQILFNKLGVAGVKLVLDVAGTVPGVGEVVEGIRVIDDLSKSGLAVADTVAKLSGTTSDLIENTRNNYNQIMNEKKMSEQRIQKSIDKFKNTNSLNSRDYKGGSKIIQRKSLRRKKRNEQKTKRKNKIYK